MLADTIKKIVKQVFSEEYQHDELLDKKTLAKEVLHCDPGSVDELFATQHGFPYMLKGSRIVYSRKAVEKWIADNQRYF
ncbi:hypothetical protein IV38_GL000089 [Lactobacillus selangorensis]|uniref:Helix-turn-helix domain-containing protein n=2 Tax=Lactobacillus selangorensis TaxID=81857 RepID=A0A0R2FKQ3_9LACO|nr:hypothetical protein IV38_GL000089 [Lactobacillus selangorensis]KRN31433.1 hypothetical protein IV40_GL001429 [Lactobacillus selangorensis]